MNEFKDAKKLEEKLPKFLKHPDEMSNKFLELEGKVLDKMEKKQELEKLVLLQQQEFSVELDVNKLNN